MWLAGAAAAAFCWASAGAHAQPAAGTGGLDLDARLAFIEHELDSQRLRSQAWQYGWMSVDMVGLGLGSYQATVASDAGHRATGIVDATKSALDLLNLTLLPLPGLHGADPIRAMPGNTPEQRQAQLDAAERLLARSAARATQQRSLIEHIGNVGINVFGGAAILGFGDPRDALIDTVTGIAMGELMIFTAPWAPVRSLAEYRSRFGGLASAMQVRPRPGGLEVAFRF
jgi:hypothetical protein